MLKRAQKTMDRWIYSETQNESGGVLNMTNEEAIKALGFIRILDSPGLKEAVMGSQALKEAIAKEEELLGGDGRVLVRPSGTEPLIRVMVEAKTTQQADDCANRIAGLVKTLKI